ncbi:hypothetical protein B4U80_07991 [Leptotrombidium deliense]|uniref:Essential MCU regulator, mitochondrial n=1 Tax=Leptotrombidium deliense TaxID=299467 RepID=A0A443SWB0_9ACAR|nr:hypothetical protein B4U80_07991 [Leptotrombidium deliense]
MSSSSNSKSSKSHNFTFSHFSQLSAKKFGDQLDDFFEEHKASKLRFGMLKVITTIMLGVYFGAFIAKLGANLLEEYEIFVRGDDDDD